VNTIGPKVWLTPGSISVAVDRLVKRGPVSRKDHPDDRRVRQVELTPKGRALISQGFGEHAAAMEKCGRRSFQKRTADTAAPFEEIRQHAAETRK
jgi:MarR family transcriptional regulator, 2-MHQ and catechol-resistance regulon repressor